MQGVVTLCYKNWIASGVALAHAVLLTAMTIKNNFSIFNYAFSYALKNRFEIISPSNYSFCYKNYSFNLNQVFSQ